MKVNGIANNQYKNYKPAFKKLEDVRYSPELLEYYDISEIDAYNPLNIIVDKLTKAFRLLFSPKNTATANDIKEGIDIIFDDQQTRKVLDKVA